MCAWKLLVGDLGLGELMKRVLVLLAGIVLRLAFSPLMVPPIFALLSLYSEC